MSVVTVFPRLSVPGIAGFDASDPLDLWRSLPDDLEPPPGAPIAHWKAKLTHRDGGTRIPLHRAIEKDWPNDAQLVCYAMPLWWGPAWKVNLSALREIPRDWRPILTAAAVDIDWSRERKGELALAEEQHDRNAVAALKTELRDWRRDQLARLKALPEGKVAAWWSTRGGIHVAWRLQHALEINVDNQLEINGRRRALALRLADAGIDVDLQAVEWTHTYRLARVWRDGARQRLSLDTSGLERGAIDLLAYEPAYPPELSPEQIERRERRRRAVRSAGGSSTLRARVPVDSVLDAAIRYCGAMPASVEGQHGDLTLWRTCYALAQAFALTGDEIIHVLSASGWTSRCSPPWTAHEIAVKARRAPMVIDSGSSGFALQRLASAAELEAVAHEADRAEREAASDGWHAEVFTALAAGIRHAQNATGEIAQPAGESARSVPSVSPPAIPERTDRALRPVPPPDAISSGVLGSVPQSHGQRAREKERRLKEKRDEVSALMLEEASNSTVLDEPIWTEHCRSIVNTHARLRRWNTDAAPEDVDLMGFLRQAVACESVRWETLAGKRVSLCERCGDEVREYHCGHTLLCEKCSARHAWRESQSMLSTIARNRDRVLYGMRVELTTPLATAFSGNRVYGGGIVDDAISWLADKRTAGPVPRVAWISRAESRVEVVREPGWNEPITMLTVQLYFVWMPLAGDVDGLLRRVRRRIARGARPFGVTMIETEREPVPLRPIDAHNGALRALDRPPEWTMDWRLTAEAWGVWGGTHMIRRNRAMDAIWSDILDPEMEPELGVEQPVRALEVALDRIVEVGRKQAGEAINVALAWLANTRRSREGKSLLEPRAVYLDAQLGVETVISERAASDMLEWLVQRWRDKQMRVSEDGAVDVWDVLEGSCLRAASQVQSRAG